MILSILKSANTFFEIVVSPKLLKNSSMLSGFALGALTLLMSFALISTVSPVGPVLIFLSPIVTSDFFFK